MSRDLTPRELYFLEQMQIENGLGSLWDFMKNTTWHIGGESWPLVTEDRLSQRQQFPLLGRLFNEYDRTYSYLSSRKGGLELLGDLDKQLDHYIQTGEGEKDSPLIKWFEGSLDEHFYYGERNDSLFFEFIQENAKRLPPLEKMPLDQQIQSADSRSGAIQASSEAKEITVER